MKEVVDFPYSASHPLLPLLLLNLSQSIPPPSLILSSTPASIGAFIESMTEGMLTRARALDEQLSTITEQLSHHDDLFSKLDTVCSAVQQHSNQFDTINQSFDTLQRSMAA